MFPTEIQKEKFDLPTGVSGHQIYSVPSDLTGGHAISLDNIPSCPVQIYIGNLCSTYKAVKESVINFADSSKERHHMPPLKWV